VGTIRQGAVLTGPNTLRFQSLSNLLPLSRPLRVLVLLLFFAVMVFMTAYPVGLLFVNSFHVSRPGEPGVWGLQGWIEAFSDGSMPAALMNTFSLAIVRTVITTVLAIFFAWVITRTDTPFKSFIEFMLWLGFFLPALPMTIGWILLLDPRFGVANKWIMGLFDLSKAPLNIYSYWGIVWAHLAFSTSIRFLLLTPAFRAMDAALEDAARVSGSGDAGTLLRITVPILAPAILATTALGFIRSLESFEIEVVLGIRAGIYVYSTKIWDYLHWEPPSYGPATALSSLFLLTIFALIWLQRNLLGSREYTTVTGRSYTARPNNLGQWRWLTFALCLLFIIVMIFLPLSVLIMGTFMRLFGFFNIQNAWTFRHWAEAFDDPIFLRSLKNTLFLGLGAALTGVFFYALVSYVVIRSRLKGRAFLDFLSWLPWALPGVLISLALLWVFLGSGKLFIPLYGTIYLLILAIIIKELPLGTQVFKASILQISHELEEASYTSGAIWIQTFRRILVPLLMPTLFAVGLIVFISAVRDIPTVVFLASSRSETISLLMLDYLAGAEFEKSTVIGVFIVLVIIVAALIGRALGVRLAPRH
jgi:iron(III) transport system permease protein